MRLVELTRTRRVTTLLERNMVLDVLAQTYGEEKGWVENVETLFPETDLDDASISWFLAARRGQPVGVLRVCYAPPIKQYLAYGLQGIDSSINLESMIENERLAEIGRFAVVPERRRGIGVVLGLMRAATREIVSRNCTQLVTDVFENDPHSPLGFHMRVAGFRPVATHEVGELKHKGRRITLLLDLKVAYQQLKLRSNRFFRALTRSWTEGMHRRLEA